jgi:hypothetical protein
MLWCSPTSHALCNTNIPPAPPPPLVRPPPSMPCRAAGAYEHFAEPLELPGIVGVELEGGERLFSLDALAARCGLDLAPEQLAAYAAAHGARLRGVVSGSGAREGARGRHCKPLAPRVMRDRWLPVPSQCVLRSPLTRAYPPPVPPALLCRTPHRRPWQGRPMPPAAPTNGRFPARAPQVASPGLPRPRLGRWRRCRRRQARACCARPHRPPSRPPPTAASTTFGARSRAAPRRQPQHLRTRPRRAARRRRRRRLGPPWARAAAPRAAQAAVAPAARALWCTAAPSAWATGRWLRRCWRRRRGTTRGGARW